MDSSTLKRILAQESGAWNRRRRQAAEALRYYRNETDSKKAAMGTPRDGSVENPLRQADNRLSHRWHGLLTDQKASYVATYPPIIDLGDGDTNKRLQLALGDSWGRDFRHLAIDATNGGRAWLHVWEEDGKRLFGVVEDAELLPLYTGGLKRVLSGMVRRYRRRDEAGEQWAVAEHWDDVECTAWQAKLPGGEEWIPYDCFLYENLFTGEALWQSSYRHGLGEVPFIPFPNNILGVGDLRLMYKDLVDVYDRVVSGYANDIEDIQQVIFVLDNYGGENAQEFLDQLRHYKVAKLDREEPGAASNLSTLAVDIPVEARNSLLDRLRRDILIFGQGVDPDVEKLGDVSGVGIKHRYGLLELKAGALETEFRPGVAALVRMLLPELSKDVPIKQTWTRNLIQNDLEQAQILQMLAGVTSRKTLDENNPLVDDVATEEERREAEEERVLGGMLEEPPAFIAKEE